MGREKRQPLSKAEWEIMKVLWKTGPSTVRQCLDALAGEGEAPAYTTVMTMMSQLADKDVLTVDKDRQPFVYTPAVRRDQVMRERVADFLHTVFDDHADELVLHLAEQVDLEPEDIRRIEAKIAAREGDETRGDPETDNTSR